MKRWASVALLFVPALAWAHKLDLSHIDVRAHATHLTVTIDIDPHDLPLYERIDRDGDGTLTMKEVEAQRTALDALIAGRLVIKGRGSACVMDAPVSEFHADVSMWHTVITAQCQRPAQEHTLYFGHLATLTRTHQAFTKVSFDDGSRTEAVLSASHALLDVGPVNRARLFFDLTVLGAEHIFAGFDHIAFVLALLLSARTVRSVLMRLTAFTVAHSLTLVLALLDVVHVSSRVVEPLIALSIAVVALEMESERQMLAIAVTFAFGLLHGLGFASAIEASAFSDKAFAVSIAGFNVGIELGQLTIVLLAWPVLKRLPPLLRRRAKMAGVGLGVGWALVRVFAG